MTKKKKIKAEVHCGTLISDENTLSFYFQEINRIPMMSKEEEEKTARLAAEGNVAAREKMVNSNLRFVIMVAKKFQGKGLPLEDLIGEGNIGLMNAIRNFDVEKGYRFITYAVWWIRQAIIRAIHEKGRMIRLPSNKTKALSRIERSRQLLQNEPGWSTDNEVYEIAKFLDITPDKAEDLIGISHEVVSLDDPVARCDESLTIKDLIEDENQRNSPVEKAINTVLREDVEEILNRLGEKTAAILRNRYGLGDSGALTLKEIGNNYNLSRERVRQIEKRALRQLLQSSQTKRLESYIA